MRILVVEDERKVARFLEKGLREERYAVEVAGDGEEGLYRALNFPFDLVILDVLLPKLDGFQVLARLRGAGYRGRVLMLTARAGVPDRVRGLEGGADDYLTKPFAFAELLARVRVLLRREAGAGSTEPEVLRVADLVLEMRSRKVVRAGRPVVLSSREFDVLALLMGRVGEVVSRTALGEQVWDEHFDAGSNVIDVTVYHLREKVDRGFGVRLIHTVRGSGYVLREEEG